MMNLIPMMYIIKLIDCLSSAILVVSFGSVNFAILTTKCMDLHAIVCGQIKGKTDCISGIHTPVGR